MKTNSPKYLFRNPFWLSLLAINYLCPFAYARLQVVCMATIQAVVYSICLFIRQIKITTTQDIIIKILRYRQYAVARDDFTQVYFLSLQTKNQHFADLHRN
jgi:hypothetical protein